jgi:peptidoglycan hydrolase FlgJ
MSDMTLPVQLQRSEMELPKEKREELMNAAKGFEAIFINQMVNAMRQTVNKGGIIPESQAEKVYQSMLDAEYAQKLADTEQIGLSHMIYDHLLRAASR